MARGRKLLPCVLEKSKPSSLVPDSTPASAACAWALGGVAPLENRLDDGEEVVMRCGRPGRHGVLTLPTRLAGFALAFILAFTDMASLSVAHRRCVGGLLLGG